MPEDDVDVANMGTVRVRGLTRIEGFLLQKIEDLQTRERKMVTMAMVAPAMEEHEVGQWQNLAASGELDPVAAKILELSGQGDGAGKLVYKAFEAGQLDEFRVRPSGEAGPDGGGIEGFAV
jgi:hypothetical protein